MQRVFADKLKGTEHVVPCYRCGARQTDPDRGTSRWRRGVRGTEQVLVCPECRARPDWTAELDRCPLCGSTALVRRLGQTVCRSCESSPDMGVQGDRPDVVLGPDGSAVDAGHDLAAEVAAAIDRVLGRVPAGWSAARPAASTREVP